MAEQNLTPSPKIVGFNKTRLLAAAAVVLGGVLLAAYVLNREPQVQIQRPAVPVPDEPPSQPAYLFEAPPPPPAIEPPPNVVDFFAEPPAPSIDVHGPPEQQEPAYSDSFASALKAPLAPSHSGPSSGSTSALDRARANLDALNTTIADLQQPGTLQQILAQATAEGTASPDQAFQDSLRSLHLGADRQPVLPPAGRYVLLQGTTFPVAANGRYDSSLPGPASAHVLRAVRDSVDGNTTLIPAGSRLVGTYDSSVSQDKTRLHLAWTRIIFPDGSSRALPQLPSVDQLGAAGLKDKVNRHTGRLFGQAALLSILSAGFQLAQPSNTSGSDRLTPLDVAGGAAAIEFGRAATQILDRSAQLRPTLVVRPGHRFHVYLSQDLQFDSAY